LDKTRALRHSFGLRKELLKPLRNRKAARRHWLDQWRGPSRWRM